MPSFRVLAADLVTGTIRSELPFVPTFGRVLNGSGTISGTIGQDHDKATALNLTPARTALYVERDGRIVWGGIMWSLRRSEGSRTLELAGQDWVGWPARRNIRHTLLFPATYDSDPNATIEQFDIVRGIVNYLQQQQDLGIVVDAHDSGAETRRKYPFWDRKTAGEAIAQLSSVNVPGFDYAAETTRDPETDEITRHIRLYYPRRGRRTNHVWEYGTNVDDYSYTLDGERIENQVDTIGAGEEEAALVATATDPNQWSSFPILDGYEAHKDVVQQTTLQGHADTRLKERRLAVETLTLKLKANAKPSFSSWIPGDEAEVRIDDKAVQVSGFWRVISDQVEVSDSGDETVTVNLTRPEVSLHAA